MHNEKLFIFIGYNTWLCQYDIDYISDVCVVKLDD